MNIQQRIAVRALIIHNDKILIIRESQKYEGGSQIGKYDLIGGKVELGETLEQAIVREVKEEAGLEVTIQNPFYTDEWRPIFKDQQLQIIAIFFICNSTSDKVTLSKEHDDYQWIDPSDLNKYQTTEPVRNAFEAYLKQK